MRKLHKHIISGLLNICYAKGQEKGTGVVKSVHPRLFEKHRAVEEIKITTLIGQATYIYIPTRDAMS